MNNLVINVYNQDFKCYFGMETPWDNFHKKFDKDTIFLSLLLASPLQSR